MTNSVTYNNADTNGRARQLRTAKIEESVIAGHAESKFESLPQDVQSKLNASAWL